jgi:peptide/nickel transport system permease protein
MLWVLVRRTAVLSASLLAASVIVFGACSVLPGDAATVLLGDRADPSSVAALRHELGTDRPLPVQYAAWAAGLVHGDFGTSYVSRLPVWPQIAGRLEITFSLAFFGTVIAVLMAVPLGTLATRRRTGPLVSVVSQAGMAVPVFWAGIMLAFYFAVRLRLLPAGGYVPFARNPYEWGRHLVLPSLSLGLVQGAVLVRYVRASVLAVMHQDYIRTARATGRTWWGALWRHGPRNAAVPLLTVLGLQLATMLAGAVVIESVFTLPGLGLLLLSAVSSRDLLLVQGTVMVLVALVLAISYAIDLLYVAVDPRLRVAR